MDSASVGFSLILRASSFSNSYDAVLAVIYLGILSIVFFPPLRGGLGWGCSPPPEGRSGGVFIFSLPPLVLRFVLLDFSLLLPRMPYAPFL